MEDKIWNLCMDVNKNSDIEDRTGDLDSESLVSNKQTMQNKQKINMYAHVTLCD